MQSLTIDRGSEAPEPLPATNGIDHTTSSPLEYVNQVQMFSHFHPQSTTSMSIPPNGFSSNPQAAPTISPPTQHKTDSFEHDPLSNLNLAWGAPQNDVKWMSPITSHSEPENGGGQTTPAAPPTAAVPESHPSLPQISQEVPQQEDQDPLAQRKAPVFNSMGFIPFAAPVAMASKASKDVNGNGALGNVPDESGSGKGDIWDVPVTPRK